MTTGINLSGTWKSPDDAVVQIVQDGHRVTGSYRGGHGHPGLTGTFSGTFDGSTLVANYANREGNITGSGTFNLTLIGNGTTLEGRWASTTYPDQFGSATWVRSPG
jgi:hypothetical protein